MYILYVWKTDMDFRTICINASMDLFALFSIIEFNYATSSVKIGAISRKSMQLNTLDVCGNTITIDWHIVDTSEIYLLYNTVQILDRDSSVDFIVLFDDNTFDRRTEELLNSKKKHLIHWFINNIDDKKQDRLTLSLGKYNITLPDCSKRCDRPKDLHCRTDLHLPIDNRVLQSFRFAPDAVLSLIPSLSWRKVIIFYETSTEYDFSRLADMLSKKGIMFVTFNIEHVEDVHHLLQRIYNKKVGNEPINSDMNFIVMCKIHFTTFILRAANEFDNKTPGTSTSLKTFSRWLIVGYDYCKCTYDTLLYAADELDNVAIIAIPSETRTAKDFGLTLNGVVYDVNPLPEVDENINLVEAVVKRLKDAAKSPCLGFIIETLVWTNGRRYLTEVGYVETSGNAVLESHIFPNMNYGYNNREFIVSTIPYPPFVIKKVKNGTTTFEGLCIDLLNELSRVLNFTYSITEVPDGVWGANTNNNTFTGLVGQLQRKEVDLAAAPISEQPERHQVMDFSYPLFYEYTSVIVKKPDPSATKWKQLLDPFKWEVLLSVGAALAVITVLLLLIERWNPYYLTNKHAKERQEMGGLHAWQDAFWFMYGALLNQGGVDLPDSIAGRTLVSSWWIFCIVIVGTYCGNLIAFLTVTKEILPFNTLDEMVEMKNKYTWGTLGGSNWDTIFRTSQNPTFRAVGDCMIEFSKSDPDVLNPNVSIHIEKVMRGNYAWIGDKTSIELTMVKECNLITTKEMFIPMSYAFGLINNSPHGPVISRQILKIHEGGLFEIWKRKWWPKTNLCFGKAVSAKPISLEDVQSAFYVCCIGIVLGLVALSFEIVIYKLRQLVRK